MYARVFQFHSWQFHSWQSSWHSMSFPFSLIHSMLKPTSSLRNEVVLHWGVDLTWEIQAANASWSFKIEFYEQQDPIDPNHLNTDLLPKPLPLPISSHLFPSLPISSHLFPSLPFPLRWSGTLSSHLHDVSAAATHVVIHDAGGTAHVVGTFPHEEGVGPGSPMVTPTGRLAGAGRDEPALNECWKGSIRFTKQNHEDPQRKSKRHLGV